MSTSTPHLTLHHLQHSQSERIVWLLEELSIPYKLELHQRAPLLAPPALKSMTESGTAPVLQDGDLILSESGQIAHYLVNKYGNGRLTVQPDSPDYATYLFWLYFNICSLQPAGSTVMMIYFDKNIPDDSMSKSFARQRFTKYLKMADDRLASVKFFAGGEFTLADVMVIWVFSTFRDFLPYSLKDYPNIVSYVERMAARPAYKAAWEKGEGSWEGIRGVEPEKKAYF